MATNGNVQGVGAAREPPLHTSPYTRAAPATRVQFMCIFRGQIMCHWYGLPKNVYLTLAPTPLPGS